MSKTPLRKRSRMKLFIQLHILFYALLLVVLGMKYFRDGGGLPFIDEVGIAPKNLHKMRTVRVIKPASSRDSKKENPTK